MVNSEDLKVELSKDQVLCKEGDEDHNLYQVTKGKLLVCVLKGSQVNPIAYLGAGDYFGEMSFFDRSPRSATVVTMEPTTLIKLPVDSINTFVPNWLITVFKSQIQKIRHADELLKSKAIKKSSGDGIKPLSIDEQARIYKLIKKGG
jgi:CRP/FNR family cyclic AMP-dependent transcriptional regulator